MIDTTNDPSLAAPAVRETETLGEGHSEPGTKRSLVMAATIGVMVIAISYIPELRWMSELWINDPNYSHGFLVIPVALVIFWRRRSIARNEKSSPWHFAWVGLLVTLVARAYFFEWGNVWAESVTLLPALVCAALTFGGWVELRRSWSAIAFLGFMLPLPARINDILAQPLQGLATRASTSFLNLTGLWVISDGNVIFVNNHPLEVAQACNGLSMLMSLAATVAAAVLIVPMSPWKRIVAAVSAAPIALGCNILRIAATAWCYHLYGAKVGGPFAHDLAGWLMMPMALILVGLEMLVLSWMFVEEEIVVEPMILGRAISRDRAKNPSQLERGSSYPLVLPLGSRSNEIRDQTERSTS